MSLVRLAQIVKHRLPTAAPGLRVETVTDEQGLLDLEPVWNALLEESGLDHPFLSHEWVRTWWECFGEGHALHILLVKDGNLPVALVPLMRTEGRLYGVPVRRLEIIGNVHTQRSDMIVSRRGSELYRAIWEAIRRQKSLWDVLVLSHLPAASPTLAWFTRLARRDGFLTGRWGSRSPYIRLEGDWDAYYRKLSSKHRANLRRRSRHLEDIGEVTLEVVRSQRHIGGALKDGFRIEAASWKGRAGTAIVDDEATRRFYSLLAQRAARRGWLRLNFLRAGGRRIAFDFSLIYANKAYILKPAYDPAFATYSPYSQLLVRALRTYFDKGVREFDFLGQDDAWKCKWGTQNRPHEWLYVMPNVPRMRFLKFLKFRAVPRLQRYRLFCFLRDAGCALLESRRTARWRPCVAR